jgi:hypothetical protein
VAYESVKPTYRASNIQYKTKFRIKIYTIANEISYVAQFFLHLLSNPKSSCNYAANVKNEILKSFWFFPIFYQQPPESSKLKDFSDSLVQKFASNDRSASIHYKPTVHTIHKYILRHLELKGITIKTSMEY